MSDNLKSRGIKAFFWDFFGKIATYGTTFIVSIFLARMLEPSDFGLIAMIMVIVTIAEVFTDVGLGAALIQRRRLLPVHYSSVFYFNIFVGAILTLITYFSASWIAHFYDSSELTPLVQVMSLTFLINSFSSLQNIKLRKELNYALLTKTNFIASLISGVIGIFLAFYGAGVWSLVAQILLRGVIYNIIVWFAAKWTPALQLSFKALIQLWGFGFRIFLSGLLEAIFSRLDYIVIGKLFAPATLGYFERAKSLNFMINQLSAGSLMAVLFPMLSVIQNDLPRFQNAVIKAFGLISFVAFLLLGLTYVVSG
ncbi:MAG: lipopolysaccharide biosynthesis protein, partial [Campylobacterota bacterium]|nr:lipopolysaccharide biosynthesis protein [Campylobacterota bacterium]